MVRVTAMPSDLVLTIMITTMTECKKCNIPHERNTWMLTYDAVIRQRPANKL